MYSRHGLPLPREERDKAHPVHRARYLQAGKVQFTFADKVISSLAPTLVSFLVATIGFRNDLPTIDTPFSNKLFAIGLFGMYGMVIIGLIVNLIAMKYYELTPEKMEEIRLALESRK